VALGDRTWATRQIKWLSLLLFVLFPGCASITAGSERWKRAVDAHLDFSQGSNATPLAKERYEGSAQRMIGGRFGWKEAAGELWLEQGAEHSVAYYYSSPITEGVYLGRTTCNGQTWDIFLLVVSCERGMWYEFGAGEGNHQLIGTMLVARRAGPNSLWLDGMPIVPTSRVFSDGLSKMTYESKYQISCHDNTIVAENEDGNTWTVNVSIP